MDYREYSFCKQDLPHIGALCRRVRESRGVNANQLAKLSGIAYSATITKFEQRGEMSPLNFQRYLNAFRSPDIVDPPLADHQIQMLQFLYEERKAADIQKRQCQFSVVNFKYICSEQRPTPLAQMVQQLENSTQPGMILDDLWFIHAINQEQLRIHGVEEAHMGRWEMWHSGAARIPIDTPIRSTTINTDEVVPQSFVTFFEHEHTFPYLFTLQMRKLCCRILNLAERHHHGLRKWWHQITAFLLPFNRESSARTLSVDGSHLRVEPRIASSCTVEFHPGFPVRYHLVTWHQLHVNGESTSTLHPQPPQRVLFAADYDVNGDFHVNTWPEVASEVQSWILTGKC